MAHINTFRGVVSPVFSLLKETLNFMFPENCTICGRLSDADGRFTQYERFCESRTGKPSGLNICGKCLSSLVPYDPDKRWLLCLSNPYEDDPVPGLTLYMPMAYDGVVKKAVPIIKFGKKPKLANLFGCILGSLLKSDSVHADLVIPVPLSSSRLEERGFNQASEIARPVADILGIAYSDNVLMRTRNTSRQTELTGNLDRIANVTGAFKASEEWDLTGMTVIVVDDVATTGFTLHEAALALHEAGCRKVLCVAFAGNRLAKNKEPF